MLPAAQRHTPSTQPGEGRPRFPMAVIEYNCATTAYRNLEKVIAGRSCGGGW